MICRILKEEKFTFSFFLLIREIFNWFIAIISLQQIYGHGRMEDPPARNAAWRYGRNNFINVLFFLFLILLLGFDVPANYDDVGLNCGGLSIQKANSK